MAFTPTSSHEFGPTSVRWSQDFAIRSADTSQSRLRSLGVQVPSPNRIARAKARLISNRESGSYLPAGTGTDVARAIMEAHRTLMESFIITSALDIPDELLRLTLKRLLEGHDHAAGDAKSTPRDMQFELLLAAIMKLGGIADVKMGEPDIQFQMGALTLGVAVKRVRSPRKLGERVGEALRQLEQQSLQGFIALKVDAAAEHAFLEHGEEAVHHAVTAIVARAAARVDQCDAEGRVMGIVGLATVFAMQDFDDGYAFSIPTSVAMHWRVPRGMEDTVVSFSDRFGARLSSRLRSLLEA